MKNNQSLFERAKAFMLAHHRRKMLHRVITVMAVLVVFVTTYMLVLPAITMVRGELICGKEEHVHKSDCYTTKYAFTCGLDEADGHEHTDDCLTAISVLTCEKPEHYHDDSCYAKKDDSAPASQPTAVGDDEELIFEDYVEQETFPEDAFGENGLNTSALSNDDGQMVLESESETETEPVYYCGLEEHAHTEDCFAENGDLLCTIPAHVHTKNCLVKQTELETETETETESETETETETASEIVTEAAAETENTTEAASEVKTEAETEPQTQKAPANNAWGGFGGAGIEEPGIEAETGRTFVQNPDGTLQEAGQSEIETEAASENETETESNTVNIEETESESESESESEDMSETEKAFETESESETETEAAPAGDYMGGDMGLGFEDNGELSNGIEPETEETESNSETGTQYICGLAEHTHTDACYDEEDNLICGLEEHVHSDLCVGVMTMADDGDGNDGDDSGNEAGNNNSDNKGKNLLDYLTSVSVDEKSGTTYDASSDVFSTYFLFAFGIKRQTIIDNNYNFYLYIPDGIMVPEDLFGDVFFGQETNGRVGFNFTFKKDGDGKPYIDVTFREDYVKEAGEDISGAMRFEGKLAGSTHQTDGDIKVQFKQNLELHIEGDTIKYDENETYDYDIAVQKSGEFVKDGNKIKFTVYVDSRKGTPDAVVLKDLLTEKAGLDLTGPTNVEVKEQEVDYYRNTNGGAWQNFGNATPLDSTKYSFQADPFELTLPQMTSEGPLPQQDNGVSLYKGKRYIVTYEYDLNNVPEGTHIAKNKATASSKNGEVAIEHSAEASVTVTNDTLAKTGSYDQNSETAKWTITVNGSGQNIAGARLTDDMFGRIKPEDLSISPADDNNYDINIDAEGNVTSIDFKAPEGEAENTNTYVITYTTSEPRGWMTNTVTNSATFDPTPTSPNSGDELGKSSGEQYVPGKGSVDKTLETPNAEPDENGLVTLQWHITLDVPEGGIPAGSEFEDEMSDPSWPFGDEHYLTWDQVQAWAQYIGKAKEEIPNDSLDWLSYVDETSLELTYQKMEENNNLKDYTITYADALSRADKDQLHFYKFSFKFKEDVPGPQKYYLDYYSTVNVSDAAYDKLNEYKNKTTVGGKGSGDKSYTFERKSKVLKMDGNNGTGTSYTKSSDGVVSWKVKVNLDDQGEGPKTLTIKDHLPKDSDENPLVTLIELNCGAEGSLISLTIDENGTISAEHDSLNISGTYDKATGELVLNVALKENASRPEFFKAGSAFYVTYKCQILEDLLPKEEGAEKNFTLRNTVDVYTDESEEPFGTAEQVQEHTVSIPKEVVKQLNKNGAYENGTHTLHYSIDINPEEDDLLAGGKVLTLIDKLRYEPAETTYGYKQNFSLIRSSVHLYYAKKDENGKPIKVDGRLVPDETGELPSWTWFFESAEDPSNKGWISDTIHAEIPDECALVFVYDYLVDVTDIPPGWQSANIFAENTATLQGVSEANDSKNNSGGWSESEASGWLTTTKTYIFNKVDSDNFSKGLAGAEFILYEYAPEAPDADEEGYVRTTQKYVTDNSGQFVIEFGKGYTFKKNRAYYVVEEKAPDGYELPEPERRYYFHFSDGTQTDFSYPVAGEDAEAAAQNFTDSGAIDLSHTSHTEFCGNAVKRYSYKLKKVDALNEEKILEGAEFTVFEYKEDQGFISTGITYTTGDDGILTVEWDKRKFKKNMPYCLVETKAPKGYELPEEPQKFYFHFVDENMPKEVYPSDVDYVSGAVDLMSKDGEATCENTRLPDIMVEKVWQSSKGEPVEGPAEGIEVELKRYKIKDTDARWQALPEEIKNREETTKEDSVVDVLFQLGRWNQGEWKDFGKILTCHAGDEINIEIIYKGSTSFNENEIELSYWDGVKSYSWDAIPIADKTVKKDEGKVTCTCTLRIPENVRTITIGEKVKNSGPTSYEEGDWVVNITSLSSDGERLEYSEYGLTEEDLDTEFNNKPENTVTLNNGNGWQTSWKNLEFESADGQYHYLYFVDEKSVPDGYEKKIEIYFEDGIKKYRIINKSTDVITTKVSVQKEWYGANGEEGTNLYKPESIEVQLWRKETSGDVLAGTATLNEANKWFNEWKNLPEGTYYVKELEVTGYKVLYRQGEESEPTEATETCPQITGGSLVIENHEESTEISVEKVWTDEDGNLINGENVKMQLYSSTTPPETEKQVEEPDPSESGEVQPKITFKVTNWLKSDGTITSAPASAWIWTQVCEADASWNVLHKNADGSYIPIENGGKTLPVNDSWSYTVPLLPMQPSETKYYVVQYGTGQDTEINGFKDDSGMIDMGRLHITVNGSDPTDVEIEIMPYVADSEASTTPTQATNISIPVTINWDGTAPQKTDEIFGWIKVCEFDGVNEGTIDWTNQKEVYIGTETGTWATTFTNLPGVDSSNVTHHYYVEIGINSKKTDFTVDGTAGTDGERGKEVIKKFYVHGNETVSPITVTAKMNQTNPSTGGGAGEGTTKKVEIATDINYLRTKDQYISSDSAKVTIKYTNLYVEYTGDNISFEDVINGVTLNVDSEMPDSDISIEKHSVDINSENNRATVEFYVYSINDNCKLNFGRNHTWPDSIDIEELSSTNSNGNNTPQTVSAPQGRALFAPINGTEGDPVVTFVSGESGKKLPEEHFPVDGSLVELGASHAKETEAGYYKDGWGYTWKNLPKTDKDGNPLYYYVVETKRDDSWRTEYTYEYLDETDHSKGISKVTVTNTPPPAPETTQVTVKKVWKDEKGVVLEEADTSELPEITVELFDTSNTWRGTAELNASNNWTHTWTDLPKDLTYYVEENDPGSSYNVTYSTTTANSSETARDVTVGGNGVITVTNQKKSTSVSVEKKWVNEKGDALATAPNTIPEIKVSLYRVNAEGEDELVDDTVTLKAENEWQHTWDQLPLGEYYVVEDEVNGYTATYKNGAADAEEGSSKGAAVESGTITITNYEDIEIGVEKIWKDDNKYHTDETIQVELYSSTTPPSEEIVEKNKARTTVASTIALTMKVSSWVDDDLNEADPTAAANVWMTVQPCDSTGEPLATEDGTDVVYANSLTASNNWRQTTPELPATIVNEDGTTETQYYLLRFGTNNAVEEGGIQNLRVLNGPKESNSIVISGDAAENGELVYNLQATVPDPDPNRPSTIDNRQLLSSPSPEIDEISNEEAKYPIDLPEENIEPVYDEPITLCNGNSLTTNKQGVYGATSWEFTWKNLPRMNEQGQKLYYYVKEIVPDGAYYTTDYQYKYVEDNSEIGIESVTIINTPKKISIEVTKVWAGYPEEAVKSGYDGFEAHVELWKDGNLAAEGTANLTKDNNWTTRWDNLPSGHKYEVKEATGYATTTGKYSGFTCEVTYEDGWKTSEKLYGNGEATVTNTYNPTYYTLPETGGTGTLPYTVGGALLTALATLLLYVQNKRRKEGQGTS